ncbi:ferritin-like domain-containing protein [Myxococcus sp. K38C18041901]|uniref:ferritin-like domain-containing protein n=1 Tax=Myxococcus guangdongensis TaxID=2906760 RepID=UPI0020A7E411|nr:ferritin-like domain-containing protein [Myxococcus guangdongensis]MCP3063145.1 ferritin-like domain-containing protein [Myxococcus guangdongensis]
MNSNPLLARRRVLQCLGLATGVHALGACADPLEYRPNQEVNPIERAREVGALNTLLAAEYALVDAYAQATSHLVAARDDSTRSPSEREQAVLALGMARAFQQHHVAHAALLARTMTDLGAVPVREDTLSYTPPAGFKPSVGNVLKLAANEERRSVIAFTRVLASLQTPDTRFVLASIQGIHAQHFAVLTALVEARLEMAPALDAARVVPRPFVASTEELGGGEGLGTEPDLAVGDAG